MVSYNMQMLCCELAKKLALYTSGGDWGSAVAKMLGVFHSDNCCGIHVNFMIASPNQRNPWHLLQLANAFVPCLKQLPLFLTAGEIEGIKGLSHFQSQESGRDQAPGAWYCLQNHRVQHKAMLQQRPFPYLA